MKQTPNFFKSSLSVRLIGVLLLLCMLLASFAGCGKAGSDNPGGKDSTPVRDESATVPGNETDPGADSETEPESTPSGTKETSSEPADPNALRIDASFVILRSESSKIYAQAANYVKNACYSLFGAELTISTDKIPEGGSIPEDEHVILIGETNRSASAQYAEKLRANDYAYAVPTNHTVVISGFTSGALTSAVQAFFLDLFDYTEQNGGTARSVPTGTEKIFQADYPVQSLKLEGIDASELRILTAGSTTEYTNAAKKITTVLSNWTGYSIPVETEKGKDALHAIRLRSGQGDIYYSISKQDGSIVISAPTGQLTTAVNKFVSLYLSGTPSKTMNIKVSDKPTYVYSGLSESEYSGIVPVSESRTTIRPGIEYVELHYTNRNGKPVVAHAVIVKKGAGEFVLGTPDALYDQSSLAAPLEMAHATEKRFEDLDVVAVVNGDQFGNYYPLGPTYMNGVKLADPSGLTPHCFAMMMDGTYYAGTPSDIRDKSKIWQMVGANGMILSGGKAVRNGTADWFTTTHPRTALGYDDSGALYLLEVDGRQSSISNGATFIDMAVMFQYLGATNAVNVDGGGSSIMYIEKDGADLTLVTSPSDGRPRLVVNSVLVVTKKEAN